MNTAIDKKELLKGGEFLIKKTDPQSVFTPESFDEEQLMVADTVSQFIDSEIVPIWNQLEKQDDGLSTMLMEKLGELGLLGTHMPEEYGGLSLGFITNTLIAERIGPSGGFSVSFNAHRGIGMLPLLYFGTDAQKEKYLPKLITGEYVAAYCLTEPSSGSDALAAKTKAVLNEEGTHYILNGQKMWISNAGFADIFTVFAQIDGDKFTAFIVEKDMPGLTLGEEEKKLGIKSSSTRMVFLENVTVPVENLLGEIGKGHLIAFNVLNTGRFKLGVSCLGGCKSINDISIKYANEREQFKKPISSFGAIKYKIAEQAIRTFATESVIYRAAGLIEDWIKQLKEEGVDTGEAKLKGAKEFALECSIVKILGSEVLDYCVDEAVQIHGGMGYSEEGMVAQAYRDSRINRIFEGTNEINRLLLVSMTLKKAMKGQLDIATPAMALREELSNPVNGNVVSDEFFGHELKAIENFKKILLMVLGSAGQKAMEGKLNLVEEQQINTNIADIMLDVYQTESTLLRLMKINDNLSDDRKKVYNAILKTLLYDANDRILKNAKDALAGFVSKEELTKFLKGLYHLAKYPIQNVSAHRKAIAEELIRNNEYTI